MNHTLFLFSGKVSGLCFFFFRSRLALPMWRSASRHETRQMGPSLQPFASDLHLPQILSWSHLCLYGEMDRGQSWVCLYWKLNWNQSRDHVDQLRNDSKSDFSRTRTSKFSSLEKSKFPDMRICWLVYPILFLLHGRTRINPSASNLDFTLSIDWTLRICFLPLWEYGTRIYSFSKPVVK